MLGTLSKVSLLTAECSSEAVEVRRQWNDIINVLKEKNNPVSQEFYIQQNHLSEIKEILGHRQINTKAEFVSSRYVL